LKEGSYKKRRRNLKSTFNIIKNHQKLKKLRNHMTLDPELDENVLTFNGRKVILVYNNQLEWPVVSLNLTVGH
jgi:hypothetical protein